MTRALVGLAAVVLAACSASPGALELRIVAAPGQRPFDGARTARLTVHTLPTPVVRDFAVASDGRVSGELPGAPTGVTVPLSVELLDAAGGVLARGKTPPLALWTSLRGTIDVLVGRVNTFAPAPSALSTPVARPTVLALSRGEYVAGGLGPDAAPVTAAAIYDLYYNEFQATAPLPTARAAAVALPGARATVALYGGLVAAAMGVGPTELVEIYDASADAYTAGSVGVGARAGGTVSFFPDGTENVLVAGGAGAAGEALGSAVIAAATGTFAATAPMTTGRAGHTATSVQTGDGPRVFVYGGNTGGPDAERFDPSTRAFTALAAPAALGRRREHAAALLADGRVLLTGGRDAGGAARTDAVLYDPAPPASACVEAGCPAIAAALDATGAPLALGPRYGHAAFVLADGKVLLVGGRGADDVALATTELLSYDATTRRFVREPAPPALSTARADFGATVLASGQVLLVGGRDAAGATLSSAELYFPR